MRNFIFKRFFKTEYNRLEYYREVYQTRGDKIGSLEKELNEYKNLFKSFEKMKRQSREFLAIEKDKFNRNVLVTKSQADDQIDIYLYVPYTTSQPQILTSIDVDFGTKEKTLHIDDLQMHFNSKGLGSIAMKYLLEECRKEKIDNIDGLLSEVDQPNFKRSIPYYEKFGFKIKLNKKGTSGTIFLKLNK